MKKVLGILVLVGLLALPLSGLAATLEERIEALNRQTMELKQQLEQIRQQQAQQEEFLTEIDETIYEDMSSRFQWSGDFRTRYDYYSRDRYNSANNTVTEKNETLFTNRLRLNMSVSALENVDFVGRLTMYKAWGLQNTPSDGMGGTIGGFPAIDGNSSRTPTDDRLLVDRAIVNWNNIGGSNFWLSMGRRPTTDGPPSQLRLNNPSRMATPVAYMDWPFDGATLGYAYDKLFGLVDLPGRIRFCYGRGYEAGLGENSLNDTDFAGISWDIYNKNNRFIYLQSYVAMEVFNYPDMNSMAVAMISDPAQMTVNTPMGPMDMSMPRQNIGDIYHTSLLYMDKIQNFNYFISGAWSRTDPNSKGMFNDPFAGSPNTDSENGYSIYIGGRFDIPKSNFKIGAEYNYGSEYWIGMSPGHDDMYASKLATRGQVVEVYGIYDLPGKAVAKLGAASFRVGYQHYRYDYTGSLDWNTKPYEIDSAADRAQAAMIGQLLAQTPAAGFAPAMVKSADQVYVSFDVKF
ncbi:DUF3373 family protein [Pelovirga terrestris]|uniref:DUF3373 domain-containing protein n=1 Tax=Pelovirga terrestris TaxID=2771352 RepID=A0A8J6UGY9_9BACT|nr:DUF3373 family protein [Pelovirga terrestris]MBD1400648.1 DUF3373 domain-containing protein [Pelovirga terrestris]